MENVMVNCDYGNVKRLIGVGINPDEVDFTGDMLPY